MKKNFLFKGVAMLGTISLLANTVLPGLAYAGINYDPEPGDSWSLGCWEGETSGCKSDVGTYDVDIEDDVITFSNIELHYPDSTHPDAPYRPVANAGYYGVKIVTHVEDGLGNGVITIGGHDNVMNEVKDSGDESRMFVYYWPAVTPEKAIEALNDDEREGVITEIVTGTYNEEVTPFTIKIDVKNLTYLNESDDGVDFKVVDGEVTVLNGKAQYKVTFSGNAEGVEGTMEPQIFVEGEEQEIKDNAFIRGEGYLFTGWAISEDGDKLYEDGQLVIFTESKTLYAKWSCDIENGYIDGTTPGTCVEDKNGNGEDDATEEKIAVTFSAGAHGTLDGTTTFYVLSGLTLGGVEGYEAPTVNPATDYMFSGWNNEVDTTSAIIEPVTYTAVYGDDKNHNTVNDITEDHFTVKYVDGVDGEEIFADESYENVLVLLPTPAFEGSTKRNEYLFKGWTPTVAEQVLADDATEGVITYTATWESVYSTGDSSDPEAVPEMVSAPDGTTISSATITTPVDMEKVDTVADRASFSGTGAIIIEQSINDPVKSGDGSESSLENKLTEEFVVTTGKIADMKGLVDVKFVSVDADGNKTELTETIKFSNPVAIKIPVGSLPSVEVRVKHAGQDYGTTGLTLNPNATCNTTDGSVQSPDEYTGGAVTVKNGIAVIYTCSASSFVAYAEVDKPSAPSYSGGGGGGGSSKKSETNTGSVTTGAVENATGSTETLGEENKDETVNENNEGNTAMTEDAAVAKFGQEQIDAYKWALENGITTMKTVEEARLDQPLTRAELAKMMVVYVAKVLEKQPITTGDVSYQDVDANKLGDLAGYIKLAYQYQIMGINADGTPIEFFNPNGLVTRGEYATVFSRVLFGSKFNKEGADFYTNHLEALKAAGILSNTEPTIKEMRGWVMLMMYRSSKNIEAIEKVAAEVEATDEEVAEAEAKAEEEASEETTTEENTENAEATTGDVAEAPEAEATTGDVAETPEAEATTGDVAEVPAEASTGDVAEVPAEASTGDTVSD